MQAAPTRLRMIEPTRQLFFRPESSRSWPPRRRRDGSCEGPQLPRATSWKRSLPCRSWRRKPESVECDGRRRRPDRRSSVPTRRACIRSHCGRGWAHLDQSQKPMSSQVGRDLLGVSEQVENVRKLVSRSFPSSRQALLREGSAGSKAHGIWMSSRTAANGASLLSAAAVDDEETLRRESGDEVGAAAAFTRGAKRTAWVANERPARGRALRVADRANILLGEGERPS